MLTKQETIGRRHLGKQQKGKGNQENFSSMWLTVSGFMLIGLVSRLSLASHSDSVFPLGTRMAQPRWMLVRGILGGGQTCGVFDLSQTLAVGGGLLVPCSSQDFLS